METARETANTIINAASNLIYGENNTATTATTTTQQHDSLLGDEAGNTSTTTNTTGGEEPLSGHTGAGTASQPYDAGNTTGEPTNTTSTSATTAAASSGPPKSTDPDSATTGTSAPDSEVIKSSATATSGQDVGAAPPESGAAPDVKQQGTDKPTDAPDSEQSDAIASKNDAAESAMEDDTTSGSSGAQTAVGGASGGASAPSDAGGPKPLSENSGGPGDAQKDQMGSTSKEPGTGEQYVKSSGTKADGGDFDASNPGAGREADRLMEEKGFHRDAGNTGPPEEISGNTGATTSSEKEKTSFGQKLKDKLHIGSKDKSDV